MNGFWVSGAERHPPGNLRWMVKNRENSNSKKKKILDTAILHISPFNCTSSLTTDIDNDKNVGTLEKTLMNGLFKAGYKKEVKIPKYSPLSYGRTCVYRAVLRTN